MNQVRIKYDFGEVVLEYSTLDDLKGKLDEVEKVAELVAAKVGLPLSQFASRQPKPGYEDVYRFLPDGTVELLLLAKKNVQRVALVLFAYGQAVPAPVIENSTNIQNVISNVLTTGLNKKYFNRTKDGKYCLSPEGLGWVTTTVIPTLRKKQSAA